MYEPYCGDDEINQPNETCEPPGSEIIPGIICRDDCTYCGDGILDAGEDCDDGNNTDGDGCSAVCTNEPGGEGCTPGYWRNHFEDWPPTGYSPADDFDTTFGVNLFLFEKTLGQAVWLGGGGIRKLARHGTAALLSAAHPDVAYPYSVAEVIAFVQGGDADPLVAANELGCEIP
jgi:cysteine-rich repeat protein